MPYKPIDFQISIPRTQDGSTQQSQMNHRPSAEQSMLEQHAVKQTEQRRIRNSAVEQGGNPSIASNRDRDARSPSKRKRKDGREPDAPEQQSGQEQALHPFKGKHIDFTL